MFRSPMSAQEAIKDLSAILAELDQELERFQDVVDQVEALTVSFLIADSILRGATADYGERNRIY